MKAGDVYLVDLDATAGDESEKARPVVVLNGGDPEKLRRAIVVPITPWRARWDRNPFFFTADPLPHHGLDEKLAVDCFQLRTLSHQRFVEKLGELTEQEMARVKTAVALILDIEPEHCL